EGVSVSRQGHEFCVRHFRLVWWHFRLFFFLVMLESSSVSFQCRGLPLQSICNSLEVDLNVPLVPGAQRKTNLIISNLWNTHPLSELSCDAKSDRKDRIHGRQNT
uniref:Uncharacterized protein n=1 Tax=Geospiza parvula TaxID=87175 RepID=A0A8C3MZ99_GEOPR